MAPADVDKLSETLSKFHSSLFKILRIARKINPNCSDIEWLANKLTLAREIDPLLIIKRAEDKIWYYREKITQRDEQFFLNNDYGQFIKDDENKSFIHTLINIVKDGFAGLSNAEKDVLWRHANDILRCVTEYKLLNA